MVRKLIKTKYDLYDDLMGAGHQSFTLKLEIKLNHLFSHKVYTETLYDEKYKTRKQKKALEQKNICTRIKNN